MNTLLTEGYREGFDPAAPLIYHQSLYGVVMTIAIIATLGIAALLFFARTKLRHGIPAALGALLLGGILVLGVNVPGSPIHQENYDARAESIIWAKERYGVELTELDAKNLFEKMERPKRSIFGGKEESRSGQTLLNNGKIIISKEISGKIILFSAGGSVSGAELPVISETDDWGRGSGAGPGFSRG